MAKALQGSCIGGVVSVGSLPVPGTKILSEGVGPSDGLVVIDNEECTYVPKTSGDLKTTLDKITQALGQVISALTTIDAKPVGGTGSAPAPGAATNIAQLTSLQAELSALKGMLK
jgi:hypothetical protein